MAKAACEGKPDDSRLHDFQNVGRPARVNKTEGHQRQDCRRCKRKRTLIVALR